MLHVMPINDIKEHEELSTCKCEPNLIMENDEMILVHNAFDGRNDGDTLEFDWIELKNDFPKAFNKMSSWVKNNRFKLNPTHIELKPCQYHKGTNEVSKFVAISKDPNFLDKFFSDVLNRDVKNCHEDLGEYFFEYENNL